MPYGPTTNFSDTDLFSTDKMNLYLAAPMASFINPPAAYYYKSAADPNPTTASATFGAIDDTLGNFFLEITSTGNPVQVGWRFNVLNATFPTITFFDIEIDGALYNGGTNGVQWAHHAVANASVAFNFLEIIPLAAGVHDFKLRWRTSSGSAIMVSAARPFYYVREL